MKDVINKRKFIFGSFILIIAVALYFAIGNGFNITIGMKKVIVNDNTFLEDGVLLGDTKEACATYDYAKCKCDEIPDSNGQEQCKKGCGFCKTCKSGSDLKSDGYCYKKSTTKVDRVTVSGSSYVYLAADETATFVINAFSNPAAANDFSPKWTLSSTNGASGSANGSTYTVTATGTGKGTGSNCKETSYTVTASQNGASKDATVKVCMYCTSWQGPFKTRLLYRDRQNTSKPEKGCYYFEGEEQIEGGWSYTAYYSRCCSKPTSDFGACYGNKKYLGIATDVTWQAKKTDDRPYKYEGVSEEDCHPINVKICSAVPSTSKNEPVYTDSCEDSKTLSYKDTTKCSNYDSSLENNFYTVDCDRSISTKFDYGDDNDTETSRVLYKGQGFKFGIIVTSVHTCTARFNKETWMNTYELLLNKIKYISPSLVDYVKNYDLEGWEKAVNSLSASEEDKREVYNLWSIIKKLRDVVVEEYMGFSPSNKNAEEANLVVKYTVNGKNKELNNQLVVSDKDYVEGSYSKTSSSTKYNLTSKIKNVPEYFVMTNEANPRVVKLVPKKVYIDDFLGEETNGASNSTDGGNKIYIDYNIDSSTKGKYYKLDVTVTGLGTSESKVINNKCDINVLDGEILYRPVDITNPFINSSWEIGQNWISDLYSFTNTIKSNIWSKKSLYTFDLKTEEIDSIKSSNVTNKDKYPYLGLCDRVNTASQDTITRKICGILKSAGD